MAISSNCPAVLARNSHLMVAQHHAMFDQGCQVQGRMNVARVPGHFALQVRFAPADCEHLESYFI